MTNPTPHGQVPEAMTYERGRAIMEGERNASLDAYSRVVLLTSTEVRLYETAFTNGWNRCAALHTQQPASPTPPAEQTFITPETGNSASAKGAAITSESGTPPAEQQAAPKAAPGEPSDYQIRAITTAYEQGVGKGHQAYKSGKEIANPYDSAYGCDLAWHYGYGEGKEQAQRATKAAPQQEAQEPVAWLSPWRADQVTTDYDAYGERGIPLYTAPQPAPAPLSEMPYEKRKAIQEGEQISASDAWFHARFNMLDTLDRRNVFRAGFDRGWNAALAANGGNK